MLCVDIYAGVHVCNVYMCDIWCVCVCVCLLSTHGSQKRALDSMEMKLQATVSHSTWMLAIEHGASAGVVGMFQL